MSFIHLRERPHYEDSYDRHTVESARRGSTYYYHFYAKLEKKLLADDTIDRPGNALVLNVFYMQTIGDELLDRYERRDQEITNWMTRDEAKDQQITNSRLTEEPYCHHCHKQGLRIVDKSLMHRGEHYAIGDSEDVLFMLKCPHCDKNSAFWEDGDAWKPKPTLCPKCSAEMAQVTRKAKQRIGFTYTCASCNYSYKDKLDLSTNVTAETKDPAYDKDRVHYCLQDKAFREKLIEIRRVLNNMAEFGKEHEEREDNRHIYETINTLKKPKIAGLATLLTPALSKAGYVEFALDKPEIGRHVYVGFNCLDDKSERKDYDSRKQLKKLIETLLIVTNWRLTSDGIGYRLGYLSGRLRAYESGEDLMSLVVKTKQQKLIKTDPTDRSTTIKDGSGRDIKL